MPEGNTITNKKDALGNYVIIGNTYGYSTDTNGVTTIGIGYAKKETTKGITLELTEKKRALYSDEAKQEVGFKRTANTKASKLFPVTIEEN